MKNGWIKTTVSALGIIGTVAGGVYFIDDRFAKAAELTLVAERLDVKIWQDHRRGAEERRWRLEDKYDQKCDTPRHPDRDGCLKAIADEREASEKLEALRGRRR